MKNTEDLFVEKLYNSVKDICQMFPDDKNIAGVKQKLDMFHTLGFNTQENNHAILSTWKELQIQSALLEKNTDLLDLKIKQGGALIESFQIGHYLRDPNIASDSKDKIWRSIGELEDIASGTSTMSLPSPPPLSAPQPSISSAAAPLLPSAINAVLNDKNKQEDIAKTIRNLAPQLPGLMQSANDLLSGKPTQKSDNPIIGAIQDLLNPDTPNGKAAKALMHNMKGNEISDEDVSFLGTRIAKVEARLQKMEAQFEIIKSLVLQMNGQTSLPQMKKKEKKREVQTEDDLD